MSDDGLGYPTVSDVRDTYLQAASDGDRDAQLQALTRLRLHDHMSACSEKAYCAGWMVGLHRGLQKCVEEQSCDLGLGGIDPEDLRLLTVLVEEAGGWWEWPYGAQEPVFVEDGGDS